MLRKTSLAVIPAIVLAATFTCSRAGPEGQGRGEGRGQGRGRGTRTGPRRRRCARPAARVAEAAPAAAQAQRRRQMIKQIKPGLYMVTGAGGNSTVRVDDQA